MLSLCSTEVARAGGLDEPGAVVISVERLFGAASNEIDWVYPDPRFNRRTTGSSSGSSIAFLGGASSTPYILPRLALDLTVAKRLTAGLGFGWSREEDPAGVPISGPARRTPLTSQTFVVAPRIGFAHGLTKRALLWARAGLTYFPAAATAGLPP